jgi:hypothetical protein
MMCSCVVFGCFFRARETRGFRPTALRVGPENRRGRGAFKRFCRADATNTCARIGFRRVQILVRVSASHTLLPQKEPGGRLSPTASQQLNSSRTLGWGGLAQEGRTKIGWCYRPLDEAGGEQHSGPVDGSLYCCLTHALFPSRRHATGFEGRKQAENPSGPVETLPGWSNLPSLAGKKVKFPRSGTTP